MNVPHPARDAAPPATAEHNARPPRLSHVHLKVRHAPDAAAFYQALLGYRVVERRGDDIWFLSAGERHHDLALQSVGRDAPAAGRGVGLYHVAFEVDDAHELAEAARRLRELTGGADAVDHGISHAVYGRDPDGNGVEIFLDRRAEPGGRAQWLGRSWPLTLEDGARS